MITSRMLGALSREDQSTRREFLSMIGNPRPVVKSSFV